MRLTILTDTVKDVIATIAVASLGALSLVQVRSLGDPFQAPRALIASIAVFLIVLCARGRRGPGPAGRLARVASAGLIVLCAAAIGTSLANNPDSSLWGVQGRLQGLGSLALLVVAALGGWLSRGRGLRRLSVVLAAVIALQSSVLLWQALAGAEPVATFGNRAVAAAWLCVAVSVVLADALVSHAGRRYLLFASVALGLLALGAAGTRGAWIGALVGAGAVIGVLSRSTETSRTAVRRGPLLALGMVGLLLAGVSAGGIAQVGAKLSPADLRTGSSASRLEIWRSSLQMVADKPFVGVGPGRFMYEFPAYQTARQAAIEGIDVRPDQAHNVLLHTAVETGVPGAIALAALVACALMAGWGAARRSSGTGLFGLAALSAWGAQAAFGVPALETDVLVWFLAGASLAASLGRESNEGAQTPAWWWPTLSRWVPAATALSLVAAFGTYVAANARYADALASFQQGRFDVAYAVASSAVRMDPRTDVYRVAAADAALYQGGSALDRATALIGTGLSIEPDSYDLLIARARLLAAKGEPAEKVASAYRAALLAFPQGVTARAEAAEAYDAAGWTAAARQVDEPAPGSGVAVQVPLNRTVGRP